MLFTKRAYAFDQQVSTHFGLGVLGHFEPKISDKKIDKFIKILELYQVFMYQYSKCPNTPILYTADSH